MTCHDSEWPYDADDAVDRIRRMGVEDTQKHLEAEA